MVEGYRDLEVRIAGETLSVHVSSDLCEQLLQAERRIAQRVLQERAKSRLSSDAQVLALLLLRAEMAQMRHSSVRSELLEALGLVDGITSRIEQSM